MRFLDHTYEKIEANLALDEALLIGAEEQGAGAVLRVWEPSGLAVVLGASGRLREDVEVELCQAEGVAIARRASGGGTVLVGPGTFNVTVVLPVDAAPGLEGVHGAQNYVLERLARAIRTRGPGVEVKGHGDLTVGDRKFGGSAQRRLKRFFLVHVSILNGLSLETIARYTRQPKRQPAYRGERTHESFLTGLRLSGAELRDVVREAWGLEGGEFEEAPLPEGLTRRLVAEKYGEPGWVERL